MHWILAITNACNALRYVTRFSCDIFGFYVAFIYLQKGIQVLTRQGSDSSFYLSVMVALLVLFVGYLCGIIGTSSLFQHYIRVFIKDYGTPLTVVFFTGFVHIGRMRDVTLNTLPTSTAFTPTSTSRGWIVPMSELSAKDVFLAIPFAILLTILFYFDHNVSSLIAQGTEFPLRKPAGFHWDLFLLGLTTGVAGILGLPFPNGLIPQAPFHTTSLCVTQLVVSPDARETGSGKGHQLRTTVTTHVVEQRFSNLAQGLLTLATMSPPLLRVLHLIPHGVLAGLFLLMGMQALAGNPLTQKLLFLFSDPTLASTHSPLHHIPRRAVSLFVLIQLLGFGLAFAITQTIAAVAFPVVIVALVPVRMYILPKWFSQQEIRALDAPTASPFTMVSVGGNFGEDGDEVAGATAVQSSEAEGDGEGVLVGEEGEWDVERAQGPLERGEGPGLGEAGESFEMVPGMRRRSVSRQSK